MYVFANTSFHCDEGTFPAGKDVNRRAANELHEFLLSRANFKKFFRVKKLIIYILLLMEQ